MSYFSKFSSYFSKEVSTVITSANWNVDCSEKVKSDFNETIEKKGDNESAVNAIRDNWYKGIQKGIEALRAGNVSLITLQGLNSLDRQVKAKAKANDDALDIDRSNRESTIRDILNESGYEVAFGSQGKTAVVWSKNEFNLLITSSSNPNASESVADLLVRKTGKVVRVASTILQGGNLFRLEQKRDQELAKIEYDRKQKLEALENKKKTDENRIDQALKKIKDKYQAKVGRNYFARYIESLGGIGSENYQSVLIRAVNTCMRDERGTLLDSTPIMQIWAKKYVEKENAKLAEQKAKQETPLQQKRQEVKADFEAAQKKLNADHGKKCSRLNTWFNGNVNHIYGLTNSVESGFKALANFLSDTNFKYKSLPAHSFNILGMDVNASKRMVGNRSNLIRRQGYSTFDSAQADKQKEGEGQELLNGALYTKNLSSNTTVTIEKVDTISLPDTIKNQFDQDFVVATVEQSQNISTAQSISNWFKSSYFSLRTDPRKAVKSKLPNFVISSSRKIKNKLSKVREKFVTPKFFTSFTSRITSYTSSIKFSFCKKGALLKK